MPRGGHNAKSTAELKAAGTYRKDRHTLKTPAGAVLETLPPPPFDLPDLAAGIYESEGQKLIEQKMLKSSDLYTLAQYANEAATYIRCTRETDAGPLVVELHNKVTAPNQYRKLAETALKNMLSLSDRLGLSPAARYRFKGEAAFSSEQEKQKDPLLEVMAAMSKPRPPVS